MRAERNERPDRDRWGTPQWLFDRLDRVFAFELDAAAEQSNAKCTRFLSDALSREPWPGTGAVWCNPPYSQIRPFMARVKREAKHGRNIVALVPVRTETDWWHEIVFEHAREVGFLRGRVAFEPPAGVKLRPAGNRPVFASAVVVFGGGPSLAGVELAAPRNSVLLAAGQRELSIYSMSAGLERAGNGD